jgi:hypothetical protein
MRSAAQSPPTSNVIFGPLTLARARVFQKIGNHRRSVSRMRSITAWRVIG